jgi:hypothetical protein
MLLPNPPIKISYSLPEVIATGEEPAVLLMLLVPVPEARFAHSYT